MSLRKKIIIAILIFLLCPALVITVIAQEDNTENIEQSQTQEEIIKDTGIQNYETEDVEDDSYDGTFFRIGEDLQIDNDVNGDVIVIAKSLTINGNINGDVIAVVAETIEINGIVSGDVRIATKNIILNSKIGRNINAFSVNLQLGKDAIAGGDILMSSNYFKNEGIIEGSIKGNIENVEISNLIGGDVDIDLGDKGKLDIAPNTVIQGSLFYSASQEAVIDNTVVIHGETKYEIVEDKLVNVSSINIFAKLVTLFGMLVVGMVLLAIFKKRINQPIEEIKKHPTKSLLWGIGYLIFIPIISFLLMFTIIGIPIALIILAIYFILLYVSQVFCGIVIGKLVTRKGGIPLNSSGDEQKEKSLNKGKGKEGIAFWQMAVGMFIFIVIVSLPVVGPSFRLLAILLGMGAIINYFRG
ncbi:hypothetical protein ACFL23_02720 [Patescibacteria group bacterium]